MKNAIALFALLFSVGASAQKMKPQFTTVVQGGLLEGEAGSAFQLKAINGITYKKWAGGVGVGIDYYQSRSLPLFLALRKYVGNRTKTPFLYADGGYNFPWLKTAEKEWEFESAKGGFYGDAGVGYQFPLRKETFLFFSVGYSQKGYTINYYTPVAIDVYPYPLTNTYKTDYTLRRLSIQAGLRF